MAFSDLGLVPEILRAVEECGYTEPTPVQAQVIPIALTGCGSNVNWLLNAE